MNTNTGRDAFEPAESMLTIIDTLGRSCLYVAVTQNGRVVDSDAHASGFDDDMD
jgi:hypothetical protein